MVTVINDKERFNSLSIPGSVTIACPFKYLQFSPSYLPLYGQYVLITVNLSPLCRYSPNAREETPRWACALCALGIFIYQSLDAIDGKQARRTNTSTPLGELFDHGCDSISTVFVAISTCISIQLGHYPNWMFFQVRRNFLIQ